MAAKRGKDLLLKIGDGATSEAFTTIAGMRTKSITLNRETIDITDQDSTDQWMEKMGGLFSASFSGGAVFKDTASEASLLTAFNTTATTNFQVIVPDFGTFAGAFIVTQMSYGGEYQGEVTWDVTLEAAGKVTFTSA